MKWEFEEKSGARICRATSMPYGSYLLYTALAFFGFGFLVIIAGAGNKGATIAGVLMVFASMPLLLLSFFTKNPVTEISVKENSLTANCVYRFSETQTVIHLDDSPEIKVGWYSNPIFYTHGGPDQGKGIYRLELVSNNSEMIDLGQSQSREELEEVTKRMNPWLLQRPDEENTSEENDIQAGSSASNALNGLTLPPSTQGIPKGQPVAVVGLALVCIVSGMLSVVWGGLQYVASKDSSPTAVEADLVAIEENNAFPDIHMKLGEHVAAYNESIVATRGLGEVDNDTNVDWVKYPVLSRKHPFFKKMKPLIKKYGSVKKIPEKEWPAIESFSMVVLTRKYKTCGDIPDKMEKCASIEGLVINQVAPLTSDQKNLLKKHFPKIDPEKVWILEENRHPWKLSTCKTLIGIGIFLLVGGALIGGIFGKKKT